MTTVVQGAGGHNQVFIRVEAACVVEMADRQRLGVAGIQDAIVLH